jgi:hypothetical protein
MRTGVFKFQGLHELSFHPAVSMGTCDGKIHGIQQVSTLQDPVTREVPNIAMIKDQGMCCYLPQGQRVPGAQETEQIVEPQPVPQAKITTMFRECNKRCQRTEYTKLGDKIESTMPFLTGTGNVRPSSGTTLVWSTRITHCFAIESTTYTQALSSSHFPPVPKVTLFSKSSTGCNSFKHAMQNFKIEQPK